MQLNHCNLYVSLFPILINCSWGVLSFHDSVLVYLVSGFSAELSSFHKSLKYQNSCLCDLAMEHCIKPYLSR